MRVREEEVYEVLFCIYTRYVLLYVCTAVGTVRYTAAVCIGILFFLVSVLFFYFVWFLVLILLVVVPGTYSCVDMYIRRGYCCCYGCCCFFCCCHFLVFLGLPIICTRYCLGGEVIFYQTCQWGWEGRGVLVPCMAVVVSL